jgi:hypothetical protein
MAAPVVLDDDPQRGAKCQVGVQRVRDVAGHAHRRPLMHHGMSRCRVGTMTAMPTGSSP